MKPFILVLSLLAVTLSGSVSMAETQLLRIQCSNQKQILNGKVEVTGYVSLEKDQFSQASLSLCYEQNSRTNCEYYKVQAGQYSFQSQIHRLSLQGKTVDTNLNVQLQMQMASADSTAHLRTLKGVQGLATGSLADLFCAPTGKQKVDRSVLDFLSVLNPINYLVY